MHVNLISSRDTGETCIYHVWSDNVGIMQGKNTHDIIREIFESFLCDYQKELKNIKGSDFVFESVDLLDQKLHRVRLKDCIEKFCKDLKDLGTEIINFLEKETIPLTNKEINSSEKQKVRHIMQKNVL